MHFSIQAGKKYWQAGIWVDSIDDATKYNTEDDANTVMCFRGIFNGCIVPNNTEWRDLTVPKE